MAVLLQRRSHHHVVEVVPVEVRRSGDGHSEPSVLLRRGTFQESLATQEPL